MTRISARGILINADKVLMIRRENNGEKFFTIPGGKQEDQESLEQTLVREFLEETSILVRPKKLLGTFEDIENNKLQHIFLCEYIEGTPKLQQDSVEDEKMHADPNNRYSPEWLPIEIVLYSKIRPDVASDFFKKFLSDYLENPNSL